MLLFLVCVFTVGDTITENKGFCFRPMIQFILPLLRILLDNTKQCSFPLWCRGLLIDSAGTIEEVPLFSEEMNRKKFTERKLMTYAKGRHISYEDTSSLRTPLV